MRRATQQPDDLVLAAAPENCLTGICPTASAFDRARTWRRAMWLLGRGRASRAGPIVTPFGGAEHDWTAIEVAAWLAPIARDDSPAPRRRSHPRRRDASRLLARASLLVQQVVGIVTEPVLIPAGHRGVLEAAKMPDCSSSACPIAGHRKDSARRGWPSLWAHVPALFVRPGLRPAGLAPPRR